VEQKVAQRLPAGAAAALRAVGGALPARGPARRLGNFIRFVTGGFGDRLRARDGLPYYEQRSMLGERLAGRQITQRAIPASLEAARRLLSDTLAYHRQVHFTGEFMVKVDGATMYHSLEARAPFLDQGLWEFAAALPPETHFHRGHLKAVLREIARRRIGPEVASRTKRGFTVPLERWLAERWSGMLDHLRGDTTLEREGWVRRGFLSAPLQDALRRREIPIQVWRLLLLEHWLEKNGGGAVESVVWDAAPAQS
jgi:asparagine synthase (glutamine-hydrolysing)